MACKEHRSPVAARNSFKVRSLFLASKTRSCPLVGAHNHRLAPGKVMPGSDVADTPPLLQELLDHAQRDPETAGHLGTRTFLVVIGKKESVLADPKRAFASPNLTTLPLPMATLFIETL